MDSRQSSPAGNFELTANTNGRPVNETDLEPVVKFYHRCDTPDDKVIKFKSDIKRWKQGVFDFLS